MQQPIMHAPQRRRLPRNIGVHLALILFSLLCVIPLWLIISASLTDADALTRNGFGLLPSEWSTFAYRYILSNPGQIVRAYQVSIVVTISGTLLGLLITALLAWPLSRSEFRLRRPLSFLILFTMLFNAGLVPYYLLMTRYLRLGETIFALIVPFLVVPFYVLILRTYFAQLPQDLLDAARIDGAGEWRIFVSITLPLSRPALATIGLFLVLNYWNDWQSALYFVQSRRDLYPLQYLLYAIMANSNFIANNPQLAGQAVPVQPLRMAMAVLAVGPAAFAFLLVQRYLVRGITLGSIK